MSDPTAQQPGPVPPPQFPFAPPRNWPLTPHGTYNGLNIGPADPLRPADTTGVNVARPAPTGKRP
jgi:hypothetical protein